MQIARSPLNRIDVHHAHFLELLRLEIGFVQTAIMLIDTIGRCAGEAVAEAGPTVTILSADLLFAFLAVMGGGL